MVTVDKYIRKLLFEQDCVIIPDFGGLLTHYIGAQYDLHLGNFQPSRKRLAFNEVLKQDDGLLTYYISTNEKIVREEAAQYVRKYVDSLWVQLKEGQTVTLDAIGVFSTNPEGKLVFEPDHTQNFNADWFGYSSIPVKSLATMPFESASQEEDMIIDQVLEETDQSMPETETSVRRSWISWAAAAVITGAIVTMSLVYKPVDNTLLSSLNPFESGMEVYESMKTHLTDQMTSLREADNKSSASALSPENSLPVSAVPISLPGEVAAPALEQEPEVSDITPRSVHNYFLIAGSFGKMKNALDLQKQLLREGFIYTQIMDNKEGNLIKVSVGSYKNMAAALEDKGRIDEITNAESWVYHQKN
jgi:cell division protein FtsN